MDRMCKNFSNSGIHGIFKPVQYRRLATRRGQQRALVALRPGILVSAYHILTRRVPYRELGPLYFDALDRQRVQQRLVQRLKRLSYAINLQPVAA